MPVSNQDLLQHYELVEFRQENNGIKCKRRGAKIGRWLGVAYTSPSKNDTYKIFRLVDGKEALDAQFDSLECAIQVAEIMDGLYKEYFLLWQEYPEMDLPNITQWTIPDGHKWHDIFEDIVTTKCCSMINIQSIFSQHKLMPSYG